MSYIVLKHRTIKGKRYGPYAHEVESVREGTKVVQKHIRYIGKAGSAGGFNSQTLTPVQAKNIVAEGDAQTDICKMSPEICAGNLGIPMKKMPQLEGESLEKWLGALLLKGVVVEANEVSVSDLKATQREIKGEKVAGMAQAFREGKFNPMDKSIIVSRDGYILDGHHRWAAGVFLQPPPNNMSVIRVDMPIRELLDSANMAEGVEHRGF